MSDNNSFGYWVRRRRKALDLTQAALARLVGCSEVTIRKIEVDARRPSRQVAELLADRLRLQSGERELFLRAARAEIRADRLVLPEQPLPPSPFAAGGYRAPPVPTAALVGREQDLAAAAALLRRSDVRLVTLSGPPGVGKTRLALRVAEELRGDFADGICFVDLSPIVDPGLVVNAVALALGVLEQGGEALALRVEQALRDRALLILLDNFEQVVAAAPLLTGWLAGAPRLKLLVTSRTVLRVSGEHDLPVPPLALPPVAGAPDDRSADMAPAAVACAPAVMLFVLRAQAVQPGFRLAPTNAAAIAAICVRLDGLPLAIELAAARIRLFSPQELLIRLERRLELLTGGARDLPPRQRTLHGALAWSGDLLDPATQAIFRSLGVFVGGCTWEAISGVCAPSGAQGDALLHMVESLLDQSLIQSRAALGGPTRFHMLETIREYALDLLDAHAELPTLRQRHADYFLELAERAAAQPSADGLPLLEQDHDNLRTALEWLSQGEPLQRALRLAAALAPFWALRGHFSEGRAWLEQLLARAAMADATRANALAGAGTLAYRQGDYEEAAQHYAASLALYQTLGDRPGAAVVLSSQGELARNTRDPALAERCFAQSLDLYRALGDDAGIATGLYNLGTLARDRGAHEQATALLEACLARYRALGDRAGVAAALFRLATVAHQQLRYAAEQQYLEECLALRRALGDLWGVAYALNNLGQLAVCQADYPRASAIYPMCMEIYRTLGDRKGIANMLSTMGDLARLRGDFGQAAAWYEEGLQLYHALQLVLNIGMMRRKLGCVARHYGDFPRARSLIRDSLVRHHAAQDGIGIAEALSGLGSVAAAEGSPVRAGLLLGVVDALFTQLGWTLEPADQHDFDIGCATARAALGEPAWVAVWAKGRALPLEDAIALALTDADSPLEVGGFAGAGNL